VALLVYLILPLIIQAFYLFIFVSAAHYLFYQQLSHALASIFVGCFVTILLLQFIGLTSFATRLILLRKSARDCTHEEQQRLIPILSQIITLINHTYATSYTLEQFQLKISHHEFGEYFALGHNVIVINQDLLASVDDDQLQVIFAQSIAMLYLGFGVSSKLMLVNQLIQQGFVHLFSRIVQLWRNTYQLMRSSNKLGMPIGVVVFTLISLIFSPLILLIMLSYILVELTTALFRRSLYAAVDKFTLTLGLKNELIALLTQLDTNYISNSTTPITRYMQQQYRPSVRITKL